MSVEPTGALFVRETTARASGGVSVLELSGPGASAALRRLTGRAALAVGEIRLARLVDRGELLDEALVVSREDGRVEVHLHGSRAVVARVLAAIGGAEAPPASWADVARRALASVASEAGARILVHQSEGALDEALRSLAASADPLADAERLLEAARRSRPHLEPPFVVLAGPVNSGKSTLFNVLVGTERALASDVPGTTRDAVVEFARHRELVVRFADTAGRRSTDDAIEDAGVALARELARRADLVLWCSPAAVPVAPPELDARVAALVTRIDEVGERTASRGRVGAHTDPTGSRDVVWATLVERLSLERDRLDLAARTAVPFDAALVRALERLVPRGAQALRDAAADGSLTPTSIARPDSEL
ncbi:MAG: GTPase [Planctomycetota bacterium]